MIFVLESIDKQMKKITVEKNSEELSFEMPACRNMN
jgi:hypothetical protein